MVQKAGFWFVYDKKDFGNGFIKHGFQLNPLCLGKHILQAYIEFNLSSIYLNGQNYMIIISARSSGLGMVILISNLLNETILL